MTETEQTLLELEGLKRSVTDSYWRAVIEDAITLIKKQKLELGGRDEQGLASSPF